MLNLFSRIVDVSGHDNERLLALIYTELQNYRILSASNRGILLGIIKKLTLQSENASQKNDAYIDIKSSLALQRRLLQQCTFNGDIQVTLLQVLENIVKFLAQNKIWAAQLLSSNDSSLLEENDEERFMDVCDSNDEDNKNNKQNEKNCLNDSLKTNIQETIPLSHPAYNPQHGTPQHANADLAHLWELNLLTTSINPSISIFTHSILQSQLVKPLPTLSDVTPLEKKTGPNQEDILATTSILNMFAYSIKKNDLYGFSADQKSGADVLINSPIYWDNKHQIYPYEKFLASYFQDDYIRRMIELKRKTTSMKHDNTDNISEDQFLSDEEKEVDNFLDDVLAKEFGDDEQGEDGDDFETMSNTNDIVEDTTGLLDDADDDDDENQTIIDDVITNQEPQEFEFSESESSDHNDNLTASENSVSHDKKKLRRQYASANKHYKEEISKRQAATGMKGTFACIEDFEDLINL